MDESLKYRILELEGKLIKVNKKLLIALEGLKVISDNTDSYNVASKTIKEINNI